MQDLNDLSAFAAVVQHKGFAAAARALNQPKSSLSRRVSRLETSLGVRLLERSTRRFAVTEAGEEVFGHAQAMVAEAQSAEEAAFAQGVEPRGVVRASVPIQIAQTGLSSIVPKFLAAHPKVQLQLLVTNRRIELIEEGVDVALRVRTRLDTDAALKMRVLGRERVLIVASPAFVARHGAPTTPPDIPALPTLGHLEAGGKDVWRLTHTDGREAVVEHTPRLAAGEFTVLLEAVLAGLGVAFLPEATVCEHLRAGRLVQLLDDWTEVQGIVHLVFTTRRGQRPAVSAFIDFLVAELPAALSLRA
ncbi:MAG TPA: LysR family transcriptional regulator [Caulobacteraceae bacterium]|jgi:DNA-binding transcriptional LysR family regulator|nr:LysR family transcriptional regulator [Caulobacteraceae bacterium]